MVLIRPAARWALRAFIVLLFVTAFGASDGAESQALDCQARVNEQDLKNSPAECRQFVIDPGIGELVSRQQLLNNAQIYLDNGFDLNFLWYSLENGSVTATSSNNLQWGFCTDTPGAGNACSALSPTTATVLNSFNLAPGSVSLTAFTNGTDNSGIVAACGNYTDPPPDSLTPTISGTKFHDANRNGQRDGGEVAIQGWQIDIYRISSQVMQDVSVVDPIGSTTTNAAGDYSFSLDGWGPGTYRLVEVQQAGWMQTTLPDTHDVVVPFGALNTDYGGNDFGNAPDNTDIEKGSFVVSSAPAQVDVNETFEITVTSTIINNGPADLITVTETTSIISYPTDCTVIPDSYTTLVTLGIGETEVLNDTFTVTCTDRSDHHFVFGNVADISTPDISDNDPSNNEATTTADVEVFEEVDLEITEMAVVCDEYWADNPFTCTLTVDTVNNGPADNVHVLLTSELVGASDCTILDLEQSQDSVMATGSTQQFSFEWTLDCSGNDLHALEFPTTFQNHPDDPHAPDIDTDTLVWVPSDIKPNSDPNSLNMKRKGVTAVAILATPEFDPLTEVDVATLTFGPTGYEAPVVRCDLAGEDANGDGVLDLVCHFNVQDTGFSDGDEIGILRGLLVDGTRFMTADTVRILHG